MDGLSIYIFVTILSLCLIVFGYWTREEYGGFYFMLSGFVILMILAITMYVNPLTVPIGNEGNISYTYSTLNGYPVVNSTILDVSTVYSSNSITISNLVASVFLLVSLFGFITTIIVMQEQKYVDEESMIYD